MAVEVAFGAQLLDGADFGVERAGVVGMEVVGAEAEGDLLAGTLGEAVFGQGDVVAGVEGQMRAVLAHDALEEIHLRAADEARHEEVLGRVVEIERAAELFELAQPQDRDLVGHGHRLDLVVGDVDHGVAEALVQRADLAAHVDAQLGVEVRQAARRRGRPGFAHHGAADGDALALAAGEVLGPAVEQHVDLQHLGDLADLGGDLGARAC
jgi:hypothetical protein